MCALLFWCSFKFSESFSRVTWNVSVWNRCGETRVEKNKRSIVGLFCHKWHIISFPNFIPSVTGNEITGWYVLIFLHMLLVRLWSGAQNSRCLCGSLARTGSRINHWGSFVPSISYYWYFKNESKLFLKLCSMYMSEKRKHHSNSEWIIA